MHGLNPGAEQRPRDRVTLLVELDRELFGLLVIPYPEEVHQALVVNLRHTHCDLRGESTPRVCKRLVINDLLNQRSELPIDDCEKGVSTCARIPSSRVSASALSGRATLHSSPSSEARVETILKSSSTSTAIHIESWIHDPSPDLSYPALMHRRTQNCLALGQVLN